MYLIIGKDREDIKRTLGDLLREFKGPTTTFYSDHFSADAFYQEVETLPFLSKEKAIVVHELDQLQEPEIKVILHYLERPNQWISLYLTAGELHGQSKVLKLVEKKGRVIRFKEEKPWEREKRLAEWLIEEAKREGLRLSNQTASALVKSVDHQMLKTELDKLICFACGRQEITLDDLSLLSVPVHHETLWQLGDALFTLSRARALEIGKALLDDGMVIFPLLGNLRSQFTSAIEILSAPGEAAKKFPYLKGGLLEKKLTLFKNYGKLRLIKGILLIFETEVKAKNSAIDPLLLLEILVIKLTHDTFSSSQFVGTSY